MDEELKNWFIEKVSQNPEYIARTYLPMLEKQVNAAEVQRDQILRNGTIEQIKYAQGLFDGVVTCEKMIKGLKLSEEKSRTDPGLLDRIFRRDLSPADNG